jgi:hypothetical protein
MKRTLVFLLTVIVTTLTVTAQSSFKKYNIKSGVVTYDQVMKMGSFEMKKKVIVYFDDYGMRECRETYEDTKLQETYFSDGKDIYAIKASGKTACKRGSASRGTELRVEASEFGTEKDRQSGKYKKLPSRTVAGKSCEMIQYDDGKGSVSLYGGWSKILMYMDLKTKGVVTTQQAVKIEENAKVPPTKFSVPADYRIQ